MKNITIYTLAILFVGILFTVNLFIQQTVTNSPQRASWATGVSAVVYKDPNCGCCEGYVQALRMSGMRVKVINTDNMPAVKQKFGIAENMQSCHTVALNNGYFIEGHVPMLAVKKMLDEKPSIEGIGLAGMPSGAPGMPGAKTQVFEIYKKSGNDYSVFMNI